MLEEKARPRGSGSGRVSSPPPISLGRKVEVDLREKQKKFEGLDRQAEQVMCLCFTTFRFRNLIVTFSSLVDPSICKKLPLQKINIK